MKTRSLIFLLFLATYTFAQEKLVGGDISMLPKYESANATYLDSNNKKITDLISYFKDEAGFNIARVRLFVNPTGATGVIQDINYILKLSKRIKDSGMKLLLDIHYSDTWADPSNQWIPAAWVTLSQDELAEQVYNYTKDVLTQLVDNGATPDYIQTGNEISYGMLWGKEGSKTYFCNPSSDKNWDRFRTLLGKASAACREICPDAKIIIHTERSGNWNTSKQIYTRLSSVDYDIIGLSYYPEWHNSISNLRSVLTNLGNTFNDKSIMIVETGYYNNWYPSNATYDFTSTYPASALGQKKFLDDLVGAIKDLNHVIGLLYWFPEENPYNNHVYEPWYNHGLFNPNNGKVVPALFSLKELNNVTTTNLSNTLSDDIDSNNIYTIDGRLIKSSDDLPHGIYIQNGKKIVR